VLTNESVLIKIQKRGNYALKILFKGRNTKMEKKTYTRCEIEIVSIHMDDVIMTSSGGDDNKDNTFFGETDVFSGVDESL